MKKLIAVMALFASASAYAFQAMPENLAGGQFETAYTLNKFAINPKSQAIPFAETVVAGNIQVNLATQQLRLTLYRRSTCPKGAMCIMMVPAPVEIVLPIVNVVPGLNGGRTIVAEQDLRPVDGGLTSLQVVDDGSVEATLTEQPARSNESIVSQLSGLPVR